MNRREAILMGAITMGDASDGGGLLSPISDAISTFTDQAQVEALAQKVQDDPATLQQLSNVTGKSPATILQAAQQATGTGTASNTSYPSSGAAKSATASSAASAASSGAKVVILAALGGATYWVGKHRGWF